MHYIQVEIRAGANLLLRLTLTNQRTHTHLVVEVADEQALGGEGVRLDLHVSAGDRVEEGRLADVGEPAENQRSLYMNKYG